MKRLLDEIDKTASSFNFTYNTSLRADRAAEITITILFSAYFNITKNTTMRVIHGINQHTQPYD